MKVIIKLELDNNKEEDLDLKNNLTLLYTYYSLNRQIDKNLPEVSCNIYEGESKTEMDLEIKDLDPELLNDLMPIIN